MTSADVASSIGGVPTTVVTSSAGSSQRVRALTVLVIGFVLLPFVVSAVALLGDAGSRYHPIGDQAIIELQLRGIFDHLPLLGPYSRFDWFHPGPALSYLLAGPYLLTGATSGSLELAAVLLNALSLVGVLLIARRRGGLALLVVTAIMLLLLVNGLGPEFFRDVWNPYVTVLPLLLLAFLAWTMSCGDAWAVPVAAGVATFLVQTHVGYALPALVLALGGFVGLVWTRRREPDRRRRSLVGTLFASAVVLAVMWLPTIVEQLDHDPGNVGKLVRFFREHGQEQSYGDAWHVIGVQLGAFPDWVRGTTELDIIGALDFTASTPFPLTLLVLVGAALFAWRRGATEALLLDLLALALVAASFVAVTRIVDDVFPYLVRWTWAVGALAWIAIAWSVVASLRDRSGNVDTDVPVARFALGLGLATVAVLSAVTVIDAADADNPDPITSPRVVKLTDAVERALEGVPGDGVVEIRAIGGAGSVWGGAGIADLLDQRGHEVRVAPDLEFAYGPGRVLQPDEQVRLVVMPVDTPGLEQARALGGWEEVARAGHTHVLVRPG